MSAQPNLAEFEEIYSEIQDDTDQEVIIKVKHDFSSKAIYQLTDLSKQSISSLEKIDKKTTNISRKKVEAIYLMSRLLDGIELSESKIEVLLKQVLNSPEISDALKREANSSLYLKHIHLLMKYSLEKAYETKSSINNYISRYGVFDFAGIEAVCESDPDLLARIIEEEAGSGKIKPFLIGRAIEELAELEDSAYYPLLKEQLGNSSAYIQESALIALRCYSEQEEVLPVLKEYLKKDLIPELAARGKEVIEGIELNG